LRRSYRYNHLSQDIDLFNLDLEKLYLLTVFQMNMQQEPLNSDNMSNLQLWHGHPLRGWLDDTTEGE